MKVLRKLTTTALVCAAAWSSGTYAKAPAPYSVTPQLVAAAQKEGRVVFYTSIDLKVATGLAQQFEAKYPGIKVDVERNGAERNFQRIYQEFNSGLYDVDVIESSDAMNFLYFKSRDWLEPAVPTDVAKWPTADKDSDGDFAAVRATLSVMGYNTKLLKPGDAPTSYKALLDPKWKGKVVKANPNFSGIIMTETYVLSHVLGWDYFKKLATQDVLQVQAAIATPQQVAQGERPVMQDGAEYMLFKLEESGAPIKPIYPSEGSPLIDCDAAIFKKAPHPAAAKLFYHYMFSPAGQEYLVEKGGMRSLLPGIKEPADRKSISQIKLLHSDPAAVEKELKQIKHKYTSYFGT